MALTPYDLVSLSVFLYLKGETERIQTARESRRGRLIAGKYEDEAGSGIIDDFNDDGDDGALTLDDLGGNIEPFHLRNEREAGTFDEQGYFVQSKEQVAETRDAWLDSIDESAGTKTSHSKAKVAAEEREKFWTAVDAGITGPDQPVENYLYRLYRKLQPGESAREAMDRFLGKKPVSAPSGFKSAIRARKQEAASSSSSQGPKDMLSFNALAETTDALSALGFHDILTDSREAVLARLAKISVEYKWMNPEADKQVFGPFSFVTLLQWDQQGCFRENPIVVRQSASLEEYRNFPPPL